MVGVDQEGQRLLLADGKRRKCARPKAKKLGHEMSDTRFPGAAFS